MSLLHSGAKARDEWETETRIFVLMWCFGPLFRVGGSLRSAIVDDEGSSPGKTAWFLDRARFQESKAYQENQDKTKKEYKDRQYPKAYTTSHSHDLQPEALQGPG